MVQQQRQDLAAASWSPEARSCRHKLRHSRPYGERCMQCASMKVAQATPLQAASRSTFRGVGVIEAGRMTSRETPLHVRLRTFEQMRMIANWHYKEKLYEQATTIYLNCFASLLWSYLGEHEEFWGVGDRKITKLMATKFPPVYNEQASLICLNISQTLLIKQSNAEYKQCLGLGAAEVKFGHSSCHQAVVTLEQIQKQATRSSLRLCRRNYTVTFLCTLIKLSCVLGELACTAASTRGICQTAE